ncbi:MAG: hypothetical protein HQL23_04385 [Candidatus Omnitrophica bacterium]|nr:hypothetical protein [Candidatus Omnitrophota bacterium]
MKIEMKKIDPTKREMSFEIAKERVDDKLEQVYRDFEKVAKLPGFRPGKVPRKMIEANYANVAKEEVLKKLIPEVYQEGLAQEQVTPLDMPEIHDVNFKDGAVVFKATFEVKPEVTIKDYKGITITKKTTEVTEDEINKTLEYFKTAQGEDKPVTVDDAFARGLGYASLEEFKKQLVRNMEMDKDRQSRLDIENQIIEALVKKAKLLVPKSLIAKQMERRIDEIKARLKKQGTKEDEIKKREEALRVELKEPVEKEVKVYFILDKIATEEKLEISEGENMPAKVMEFLRKEAQWTTEKAK